MKSLNALILTAFIMLSGFHSFAANKCSSLFDQLNSKPISKFSIIDAISNKVAETKLKKIPFDLEKYNQNLEKVNETTNPESLKTIEDLMSYYVKSGKELDSHLKPGDFIKLQAQQKLKLLNILKAQLKNGKASERQLKIVSSLLYLDSSPQSVKMLDLLHKNKIQMKNHDFLIHKYTSDVLSGKLTEAWKKNGLLTSPNKLLKFLSLVKMPFFHNSLTTIMNATFISSGGVMPYNLKGVEFSPLEIQQGILYGPSAFYKTISMRYDKRLNRKSVVAIANKVTVALAVATTTLVMMSDQKIESLKKLEKIDKQIEAAHKENNKTADDIYNELMNEANVELDQKN